MKMTMKTVADDGDDSGDEEDEKEKEKKEPTSLSLKTASHPCTQSKHASRLRPKPKKSTTYLIYTGPTLRNKEKLSISLFLSFFSHLPLTFLLHLSLQRIFA